MPLKPSYHPGPDEEMCSCNSLIALGPCPLHGTRENKMKLEGLEYLKGLKQWLDFVLQRDDVKLCVKNPDGTEVIVRSIDALKERIDANDKKAEEDPDED